jgi:hypothetical protein
MRFRELLGLTIVSGSLLVAQPRQARACGGCFHQAISNVSTVVTAHRMAFAFSSTRTVLWDQIQYAGSPRDFSWVLPVKGDATIESADDSWFDALEGVTNQVTTPAQLDCYVHRGGGSCDCSSADDSVPAVATGGPGAFNGMGGVIVRQQGSVGPYMFVQLRAANSDSLLKWLPDNGYTIPPDIKPVIEAYQTEGFDFIALRLAPQNDIRQMTPVRVITPGATPTLPLRMVAAGTGEHVGITLYVIAEGRYEAAGYNNKVDIDYSNLTFDWHGTFDTTQGTTNYNELRMQALAAGDGKNWLTSFASRTPFAKTYTDVLNNKITYSINVSMSPTAFTGPVPVFNDFTELYFRVSPSTAMTFFIDAGSLPPNIVETLNDTKLVVDDLCSLNPQAGDAGASAPSCPTRVGIDQQRATRLVSGGRTDLAAALIGMHPKDVWLTRLEANLPHAALANDLKITPASEQTEVFSAHRATQHANPPCDLLQNHDVEIVSSNDSPASRTRQAGVGALTALGMLIARRAGRRRGRDRLASRHSR